MLKGFALTKQEKENYEKHTLKVSTYASLFFDENTLMDKTTFNPVILQVLFFASTESPIGYADLHILEMHRAVLQYDLFRTIKLVTNSKKGNIKEIEDEIKRVLKKKLANSEKDAYHLCIQVVYFLFKYFNLYEYYKVDSHTVWNLIHDISKLCYANSVLNAAYLDVVMEKKKLSEEEQKEFFDTEERHRDKQIRTMFSKRSLTSDFITFPQIDDTLRKELVELLNILFKTWLDPELKDKRNKLDMYDLSKYSIDWSQILSSYENFREYVNSQKEQPEWWDVYLDFSHMMSVFISYNDKLFLDTVFIDSLHEGVLGNIEDIEVLRQTTDEEIKRQKTTIRSITRDFTRTQKELEELKKSFEIQAGKLKAVQVVEEESEELKQLRVKTEEQKSEIGDLIGKLDKARNQIDWQSNTIQDLEYRLKRYESLESDFIDLQNDYSSITAQVERLEVIEDSDDSDEEFKRKLAAIKDRNIMFIGGTGNMMAKLVELFPNSSCVDISDMSANFTVPVTCDNIVIYTKMVKHAHCRRAESLIDKDKIIYVNVLNSKLVVHELYDNVLGHKN